MSASVLGLGRCRNSRRAAAPPPSSWLCTSLQKHHLPSPLPLTDDVLLPCRVLVTSLEAAAVTWTGRGATRFVRTATEHLLGDGTSAHKQPWPDRCSVTRPEEWTLGGGKCRSMTLGPLLAGSHSGPCYSPAYTSWGGRTLGLVCLREVAPPAPLAGYRAVRNPSFPPSFLTSTWCLHPHLFCTTRMAFVGVLPKSPKELTAGRGGPVTSWE